MTQPAAVLEPASAAIDQGAELPVQEPEAEPLVIPDQLEGDAPEPEADVDPYADLTPEEIEARAREGHISEEEHRRRLEEQGRRIRESILTEQRETAARAAAVAQLNEMSRAASNEARSGLSARLTELVNGDVEYTPDALKALVDEYDRGAMGRSMGALRDAAGQYFRAAGINQIEPQLENEFLRAAASGNTVGVFYALANVAAAHYFEQGRQAGLQASGQATAAEQAAAAEAQRLQQERKKASAPVSPTAGRGNGSRALSNRQILDTAHPASAEYARAYQAEHGMPAPKP